MEWKDIEILIDGIPVKVEPYEYNMMPISEPIGTNLVADFLIKQGVLKVMPQVNDIVSKQKIDVSDLIKDATKWVGWQDLNMPCVYVNEIDIDTPYYSLSIGTYSGRVLKYKHADGWYKNYIMLDNGISFYSYHQSVARYQDKLVDGVLTRFFNL